MTMMLTYLLLTTAGTAAVPGLEQAAALEAASSPEPEQAAPSPADEARLAWSDKVRITVEQGDDELVVRFDRPLDDAEVERFAAATRANLADLRWNDDSLVMRPNEGSRIVVTQAEQSLLVRFVRNEDPAATAPLSATPASVDADIELAIARAQADAAAGYLGQSRQQLEKLAEAHPDNKQVQRALADADAAEGRTARAAARYQALDADDPMARRIIDESGGRATAQGLLREGKTFSQWEAGADVSVPVGTGLTVGGGVRYIRTRAEGVASPTGYLAKVRDDLTIADVTASILYGSDIRLSLQGSTLIGKKVTGALARLAIGAPERQVRMIASYRLPDFSTAEQAVFGGHVSRLGLGGTIRITPELVAQADVGLNGYGLPGGGVRTRTKQAVGGLDYLVLRRPVSVQLSYRLDAEYVDWTRNRPNGIPFIPLSDRENHTVQAIMSMPVKTAQLTGAAGWTKDRFGGSGPTASLGLVANLGDAWRMEAGGGISSISRAAISGRQHFLRLSISRILGGR